MVKKKSQIGNHDIRDLCIEVVLVLNCLRKYSKRNCAGPIQRPIYMIRRKSTSCMYICIYVGRKYANWAILTSTRSFRSMCMPSPARPGQAKRSDSRDLLYGPCNNEQQAVPQSPRKQNSLTRSLAKRTEGAVLSLRPLFRPPSSWLAWQSVEIQLARPSFEPTNSANCFSAQSAK